MLKGQLFILNNQEMYKKNHNKFIIENDANLIANSYIIDFLNKYCPNNHSYLEQIKIEA